MTLNGVMTVTLRYYFTEVWTHNRVDLWWNLRTSPLYSVVRVQFDCHKESSHSLSHLMIFLLSRPRRLFYLALLSVSVSKVIFKNVYKKTADW